MIIFDGSILNTFFRGWPEQLKRKAGRLVVQPSNQGTATAVFLALAYIRREAPNATVVLYPSDHFIYPADRFLHVVRAAIGAAQKLPLPSACAAAPTVKSFRAR